jgi:hypothetical protein
MSTDAGFLDGLTVEVTGDDQRADELSRDASAERLAGMIARRSATNHKCAGRWRDCLSRNHRRDQYHVQYLTSMLGPGTSALPGRDDYDGELGWHSMTADDVGYMRALGR